MVDQTGARRIALAAQGFCDRRPRAVTVRQFRRALARMAILQLDSVNVVCRSHFLPMLARLGPYDQESLDRWLWESGENMEFLSHEASITSAELLPLLAHRFDSCRWRRAAEVREQHPGYIESVLAEIGERGALSVSDLSEPGERNGPWWGSPKGKVALVSLHSEGLLAVANRPANFKTHFDLPERVLPERVLSLPRLPKDEAERELLLIGAKALGIGTATDIADYFRIKMPAARPLLGELVEDGLLREVDVSGWDQPALLHPGAKRPRQVSARALLSPFDPVVWFRPRAERLFNFRYRIEIYVPEAKRVHGYYVLPFLLGDQLVARVDLKADRAAGVLCVRAAFLEPGHDRSPVAENLAITLVELAEFLGLDRVACDNKGDLAATLQSCL
ncbi:MAG: winged helix-turn-helix domain-containing protein [Acidimicrobiales bacterium]|nr:winged helix-turn-helix domain-containing protein [Acidimicrobiales bacterium]